MEFLATNDSNGNRTPRSADPFPESCNNLAESQLSKLDASKIEITLSKSPKIISKLDPAEVAEQKICTDHMVVASWFSESGWGSPKLIPYGPISLMPTASVLHYATECFEGMKVYRGYDGKLRLFRPDLNCRRMIASATRISLPGFEAEELHKLISKLCAIDGPKWLPKDCPGSYLYIRPTMIGSDPRLGFQVPKEALLYIILSYGPSAQAIGGRTGGITGTAIPKGLRLLTSREGAVRAWPGGTGAAKVGANYGPALLANGEARRMGYGQVLWIFGPDCQVTEAGSSNFFVIWRTKDGRLQLVTAPLVDRTILAGVTRQSILELARQKFSSQRSPTWDAEPLEAVEEQFTMFDLLEAADEGRLLGSFAVGTALFIQSVSQIHFRGREIDISVDATPHISLLRDWMRDIMYGKEPSTWVNVIDEE